MKKLFTFFAAMAFVTMSFAQGLLINTTTEFNAPTQDRSDWFGYYSTSGSVFVMAAGSEYTLRIPEGTIPAGSSIERVKFYHTNSDHVTGASGTFNNETYTIRFYTGTVYDESAHSITPGTLAYSQDYTVPEGDDGLGINTVEITNPFTVPATGDITVGIYAPEKAAVALCPTDEGCAAYSFAFFSDESDAGYHHWVFGSEYDEDNNLIASHKPFLLQVYYNDGVAYQKKCDFSTGIHDPEDESNYPDVVEEIHVSNYIDSLGLSIEIVNNGPDSAFGSLVVSCYVEYNGVETTIFEDNDWVFSEFPGLADVNYCLPPNTGFFNIGYGYILGLKRSAEDPDSPCDFEELELGWPFTLCVNVEFTSTDGAIELNENNNTHCVQVINDDIVNIPEITNTLTVTPNPASTSINVANAAGSQISVYNIAGQEVMTVANAEANETLNVSNLNAGLYIVRVVNGNEVSTAKVSIVR